MHESHVLESLLRNNKLLDNVSDRLDGLRSMFGGDVAGGLKAVYNGFVIAEEIDNITIFEDDLCNLQHSVYKSTLVTYPYHSHKDSTQYLICVKGSFIVMLDGTPRVLGRGECVSIPIGMSHSVRALEDNSSMIAINVPPEKAYKLER
jgi:mannose-6-phosphate isomerase-like protein (cupin superfamily)